MNRIVSINIFGTNLDWLKISPILNGLDFNESGFPYFTDVIQSLDWIIKSSLVVSAIRAGFRFCFESTFGAFFIIVLELALFRRPHCSTLIELCITSV